MQTLKHGQLSWNVAALQWRLNLLPSGYFDDRTVKAVKAFQTTHKLKVDGEVGPITRKALELEPVETAMPFHPGKSWMTIAQSQIGVKYGEGFWLWSDNRKILEYFGTTTYPNPTPETWWCAAFVNWVITKSGRKGQNSAAAKDWLDFDDKVTNPEPGDIVIIRTVADEEAEKKITAEGKAVPAIIIRAGYHVGFYISGGAGHGHVRILGGNQSKMVKEENFSLNTHVIKGYRRPHGGNTAMYLKLGTIQGSVTAEGYQGWMQIATLNFGVERKVSMEVGNLSNREPGRPTVSQLAITKLADKSIASLFQTCVRCTAGQEATIAFVRTGNTMQEFMTYKLKDCLLSNYATAACADETPVEGIMLSYAGIEVSYKDHDAANKAGNPLRVGYDVKAAKVA